MKKTNAYLIKEHGRRENVRLSDWDMANLMTMQDISLQISELRQKINQLTEQKEKLTPNVAKLFERKEVKNINVGEMWFTYIKASSTIRVDRDKLEECYPEIFEEVKVEFPRKAQIRVMTDENRKKIGKRLSPDKGEEVSTYRMSPKEKRAKEAQVEARIKLAGSEWRL